MKKLKINYGAVVAFVSFLPFFTGLFLFLFDFISLETTFTLFWVFELLFFIIFSLAAIFLPD
jgi:hypothetical protein